VAVWIQNPIVLDATNEPQPDLVILQPRGDFYSRQSPRPADVMLLVEVADTSLDHHLRIRVPLYAAAEVPEVWVLEVATRQTHRFRNPKSGSYADCGISLPEKQLTYGRFSVTLANLLPAAS
jgi:hypothetical protein